MEQIAFAFPFEPVAKGRPRFRVCGKYVQAYTPGKTKAFEKLVANYYQTAAGGHKYEARVPLVVTVTFGMKIPISLTKKARTEILEGKGSILLSRILITWSRLSWMHLTA